MTNATRKQAYHKHQIHYYMTQLQLILHIDSKITHLCCWSQLADMASTTTPTPQPMPALHAQMGTCCDEGSHANAPDAACVMLMMLFPLQTSCPKVSGRHTHAKQRRSLLNTELAASSYAKQQVALHAGVNLQNATTTTMQ